MYKKLGKKQFERDRRVQLGFESGIGQSCGPSISGKKPLVPSGCGGAVTAKAKQSMGGSFGRPGERDLSVVTERTG